LIVRHRVGELIHEVSRRGAVSPRVGPESETDVTGREGVAAPGRERLGFRPDLPTSRTPRMTPDVHEASAEVPPDPALIPRVEIRSSDSLLRFLGKLRHGGH